MCVCVCVCVCVLPYLCGAELFSERNNGCH